ncbi:MAG: polysaccharide biosynthesis/export family protein [Pyrinomonadaceae bacterium]|nr:polysaccharide biosynthesis/export family protein [Pyrinomonadaceae bacterium]
MRRLKDSWMCLNFLGNASVCRSCALVVLLSVSGVVVAQHPTVSTPTPERSPAGATSPVETTSVTTPSTADRQYRIGPGDVLDVRVFNRPQLSHDSMPVTNDGLILLPFIGEIRAACLTAAELAKEITTRLLKYQRNPQVYVSVRQYNSQVVSIIGAVNVPSRFQLQRQVRLLELLSLANGPTGRAGRSIQVLHAEAPTSICEETPTSSDLKDEALAGLSSYNLSETLKGSLQANPYLRPGDIITIPEADLAYIIGNVFKPGPIALTEPITISRAIVMAGGTGRDTDSGNVRIIRQATGSTTKTQIVVDLKKVKKNQAEDVVLLANDTIEVSTVGGIRGAFKEVLRTIVPTVSQLPLRVIY